MHPLTQQIAALQRRLVFRARTAAACRIAATVLAAALLLGLVDYLVRYTDPGLRIMASMAWAAVATWAAYRWWYLPGRQRLVPLTVARRVEAHFPQLRDSLASAVEFLQQPDDELAAGSTQLRRMVVAEAQMSLSGLPLEEVIDRRPARRAAAALGAVGLAIAVCLAWDARAVGTAAVRLAAPWGTSEWPRRHHLAFREVPGRLAVGQAFEVELFNRAGELPEEVRIEFRTTSSGRRQRSSELMTRAGDVMIARRENVRQSFDFRAAGGDDDTMRWHRVEVVEPPRLESLAVTVHPPEYTALPSRSAEGHLRVLAGSRIELRGVASKSLTDARILVADSRPISATIHTDPAGNERREFRIAADQWLAETSGPWRVELTDAKGVAGVVGQWNLHTEVDSPPSVAWQLPADDLYVTRTAVIPVALRVRDNLAVQRVELVLERSDQSSAEREREPETRIELYRGPDNPPSPAAAAGGAPGETRLVEHDWELAPLAVVVGAELTVHGEAADYRPGVGRTAVPRRIAIITPDELDTRLADQLAQIVRQLERALVLAQATREDVRRLEQRSDEPGDISRHERGAIQSAELNQRRVGRLLVDPMEGAAGAINALLDEIEMNRLPSIELIETLDRLAGELSRLGAGPLTVAEHELTAVRKIAEAGGQLSQSLAAAGAAQDEAIAVLQRLIDQLGDKADVSRFARLLAELQQDQIEHQHRTRAEISAETLPLRLNELSRAQRATLDRAVAGQSAIAARFERIEQGMDRLATEQSAAEGDTAGQRLSDAVTLARRLAIGAKLLESARDLSENRVGQALQHQSQIIDDLQQVLDVLRDARPRPPEQLADSLRAAEDQLDALRQQLAELRAQIAATEQAPAAADAERLAELDEHQEDLRQQIAQLAQQLQRMQAADASRSTQSAADRLERSASNEQRPGSSKAVHRAEQDLEEAAEQLAAARQQAEDNFALEFVRQFQRELTEMVERQQRVVERTKQLDGERSADAPLGRAAAQAVAQLADEERRLAQLAKEHSELLHGLGAVRVSLEDAERRLTAAAALLDKQDTGPRAQQAEQLALERLEGMMEAFAQTAAEAEPADDQPSDADTAGSEPADRRPTFELLELKMLRMLQVDLNERTRAYQQRRDSAEDRPPSELARQAQELAAEQGRLAALVEALLARNNDETEE